MTGLPQPLTPFDCELRDFKFMPLDVVRLRDSDLAALTSGDEFRCAVLLWCASWHQIPAASLPDDDMLLAQYAGFGRVVKEWQKVRKGALRGWIKCTDGRLYHPVVAEKANESWIAKLKQRLKTECGRIKKHNERHQMKLPYPEFEDWMAAGCPVGQQLPVAGDKPDLSLGQGGFVTGEKHSKGQGEGQRQGQGEGQGQLTSKTESSSSQPPTPAPSPQPEEPPERENPNELPQMARNVQISLLLRGQQVQATSQNPIVAVTWAENPKVTDEVLNVAITKAKAAKPGEQIPVKYLARIVETLLAEQDAAPPEPKPQQQDWAWKRTPQGIEAKGRELGMFARGTENHADFAVRIQKEIDRRKGANP